MTPRHRWGYSDRCICCDKCPSTSVICDAQQWRHRLACCCWSSAAYRDSLRRLTVDSKSSWWPAGILTCCYTYSFVFCSLHSSVTFVLKGLDSPLRSAIIVQLHCLPCHGWVCFHQSDLYFLFPSYLNWSTSSSVFPFIHLLVDGLGLMLLGRILLLSELISMP